MKRFYKKILLFLFPVLLVWAGIEVFYRSTETNYTFKHKKLKENGKDLEVLILGNSHTLYGIDPNYFSRKTFNSANISQSLYFDELILKKHIDSLSKLKVIILPISYFSLSQKDNASEDQWRKYFYEQQMQLEVPIISKYNIKRYSLALSRRLKKSVELITEYVKKGTILGCDQNGYGLQDESNIVEDKESIASIIAKKHEDHSTDFRENTKRLQRMISLCETKDIKVILVQMPVYKTYYELLDPNKKEKISTTCKDLAVAYRNVNYLNLSQDPAFLISDLRDADHLTNEGAKKCSLILNEYIESILK